MVVVGFYFLLKFRNISREFRKRSWSEVEAYSERGKKN